MLPIRSLAMVALSACILWASGGAAAQSFPDEPPIAADAAARQAVEAARQVGVDPVEDAVVLLGFVCSVADHAREGDTGDFITRDVEWRIHVDPFECVMSDTITAYVNAGGFITIDWESRHHHASVGAKSHVVTVPLTYDFLNLRWDKDYRSLCKQVRALLEDALLEGREGMDLVAGLAGTQPPAAPSAAAETPEATAGIEALQVGAGLDPQYPAPDDIAAQSEGKAAPAQDAPVPLVDLETHNEAGPASAQASVEGASVARSLGLAPRFAAGERAGGLAGVFALQEPSRARDSGQAASSSGAPEPSVKAPPSVAQPPPAPHPSASRVAALLAAPQPLPLAAASVAALVAATAAALAAAAVALYHRLTRREIRASAPRAAIAGLLAREPGLSATRIGERLGMHRTTAEYHLRLLQTTGLVVARESRGRPAYCLASDAAARAPPLPPALRAPTAQALLDLVRARPGITLSDAAAAAGVGLSSASRHARRLHEAGLVEVRADGRFRRLFALG